MTVPAVVLVLAACLGGLRLGTAQLRLTDAAAIAARSAARDDGAATATGLAAASGADGVAFGRDGDLVCATAQAAVPLLGVPVRLTARSCALAAVDP